MNVSGLARSAPPSGRRHLAMTASAGADSNPTAARRAISSMTANPMLCRVPLYCAPGLPSPTISFTESLTSSFLLRLLVFLLLDGGFLALFLLALLDDFGLGRRRRGRSRRVGRRRDFLGLRHDHVHEHRFALGDRLPLRVGRDVADADALVQHQLADVDVDVLG